jgi:hypothetical protein
MGDGVASQPRAARDGNEDSTCRPCRLAFELATAAVPSRTADRALQHTLSMLGAAAIMNNAIAVCR